MNNLSAEQNLQLLDRLRTMARLQNRLWQEAMTIADELLDCELDAVLEQVPNLAVATSAPGDDLTYDDLDDFVNHCGRIVAVCSIRIDLGNRGPSHNAEVR
jgi:hypothetical protein